MIKHVIKHKDLDDIFWSNETGWTDYESATLFSTEERESFTPPLGGIWCSDLTGVLKQEYMQ